MPSPTNPEPTEARGPHLPDRWPILVFVGLAIAAAWATYPNPPTWTPESFAAFILDLLPVVCPVLLPAALLLRHPDAPRVARPLFFGTLLFAAVPFLRLAGPALEGFFASLTPPPDGMDWFVPSSILYGYLQSLSACSGCCTSRSAYRRPGTGRIARARDSPVSRSSRSGSRPHWPRSTRPRRRT